MEIIIIRKYDNIPLLVKSEDGTFYQLSYYDTKNRLKMFKIVEPKQHNGSSYFRVNSQRYSEYKLKTLEIKTYKKINLNKPIKL